MRTPLLVLLCLTAVGACKGPPERVAEAARSAPLASPSDTTPRSEQEAFQVREWTLDDGLPAQIEAVAQTPDGYLWLATYDGLARFDGVRFELFTPKTTPVFRSDQVLSVYVARSGDLWVGSRDRWSYRLRDGVWTAFSLEEVFAGALGEHWVGGFAEDAAGTVWAVSTGPYLARFDGHSWTRFTDRLDNVWPMLAADADGVLWSELRPEEAPNAPEPLFGRGIVSRLVGERFTPVSDPRLAGISATQYGPLVHRVAGTREELARTGRVRIDLTDASGKLLTWVWYDGEMVRAMLVDRSGRAWVQRQDVEGQNALAVVRNGRELARLAPEGATWFEQVFEDRQGAVWTFASSTGLLRITEDPFQRYTTDDGVPRYAVRAALSSDGEVLVSTQSTPDDVRVAEIRDGRVQTLTYRPDRVPALMANRVRAGKVSAGLVVEDARGQRWGVAERYLLRLGEGRAEVVTSVGAAILRTLAPDPSDPDILWAGDNAGAVYRIDTEAGVVSDSVRIGAGTPSTVWDIHRSEGGRLWVGSDDGLTEIGPDRTPHPLSALAGRSVRSLADGPDGALWAATDSGLVRVRGAGSVRVLGTSHGLPDADLSAVLLDEVGFVWVSSGRLLHRFRLDDAEAVLNGERGRLDVVSLSPVDGHLGPSPSIFGTAQDALGGLWIPSVRGVTRLDPMLYARQHGRAVEVVPEGVATEAGEVQAFARGLELPLGERTLTVSYTATDLLTPEHVRFRTFLEGHDAEWVDRGADRRAVYGGLEPGRYTLWVQAINAGGVWSEPVAAPSFAVPARFYETFWFYALCALALGLAIGAGYRMRLRQLRRRQQRLERTVAIRTEDLRLEKQKTEAQAERLREMDAAKGRFFANVSHELRTPLALLLGPIQDLRRGRFAVDPEAAPLLDRAAANGRRLQRLVEDLLTLTQADGGALTLRRRRFDLVGFVRDRVAAFGSRPAANGLTLRFEAGVDRLVVDADPAKVETVVYNLVGNALKFTPAGGTVTASVHADAGGGARLHVADTGIGVAPDGLDRLFDRFYQADTEAARTGQGAGIGLALVREIVELHGGAVEAESALGDGTTITVRLPPPGSDGAASELAADDETALTAPPPLSVPFEGDGQEGEAPCLDDEDEECPLVLVVEDNADLRAYLRTLLADRYRVEEAVDGAGGLSMAVDRVPDLVVSDVMMPGLDGFTLLAALKGDVRTSHVPVVLLTARADAESRLVGLARGADAYLAKPFDSVELGAVVENLIAGRQRLRAAWGVVDRDGRAGEPPTEEDLEAVDPAEAAFLRLVCETIEANLADAAFDAGALAEAVAMSPRQLRRKLGALTDETPSQLVRRVRVERAAALLEVGGHAIKEIAYQTGFASASGFRAAFRERFRMSPSAYARAASGPGDGEVA